MILREGIQIRRVGKYALAILGFHTLAEPVVRLVLGQLARVADTGKDLALDISAVRRVDSVGMSLLLATRARVVRAGAKLVLVGLKEGVKQTLRMGGLGDLFLTCDAESDLMKM